MPTPRIIGLETEYGCLVDESLSQSEVVHAVRDWFFEDRRYGLLDLHHRGWDEPVGNGGFLFNGGRVYIDMGHMEYCTPECTGIRELITYDRAGDLLLMRAVEDLGFGGAVRFIRNNIDHYTQATFGCHENYLMDRRAPFTEKNVLALLAFQSLRVIMTGAGRIGHAFELHLPEDAQWHSGNAVPFQISQRADYIENDFFQWVQHNRAIVNTRDEPLADPHRFRRLHVLHGDTNVLPAAHFLKLGATSLMLDLLEADAMPDVALEDAVSTLQSLSRKCSPSWRYTAYDGGEEDAVDTLGLFLECARREFNGRDEETDGILDLWTRVLDALASDPDDLVGILDWVSKKFLLERFMENEGLDWNDPWLLAQDLEYHQADPSASLGLALATPEDRWDPLEAETAAVRPPARSRARRRSELMRRAGSNGKSYSVDWDHVQITGEIMVPLIDPYEWHTKRL
jgi:proteasome accessory factor A